MANRLGQLLNKCKCEQRVPEKANPHANEGSEIAINKLIHTPKKMLYEENFKKNHSNWTFESLLVNEICSL